MKTKLTLKKETVDLLDSLSVYGGAGTLQRTDECKTGYSVELLCVYTLSCDCDNRTVICVKTDTCVDARTCGCEISEAICAYTRKDICTQAVCTFSKLCETIIC